MSAPIQVTWFTTATDVFDHAVTDEEFVRGRRDKNGQYQSLCGNVVLPCSMLVPPGRPCPRCNAYLAAQSMVPAAEKPNRRPQHRRPSRWRQLFFGRLVPSDGGERRADKRPQPCSAMSASTAAMVRTGTPVPPLPV
jgi:hypothetical protein